MADADFVHKHFPSWLGSMSADVQALAKVVGRSDLPKSLRAPLVGGLGYLFRALDIIPDWFPALGLVDDAMVLRVAASLAAAVDAPSVKGEDLAPMYKLSNEADLVKEVLGEPLSGRFVAYVEKLATTEVRGRTAESVLRDDPQMKGFLDELAAWVRDFKAPTYEENDRHPEKLRQFMGGKLTS